jgi:hypothetical protein
LIPVFCPKTGTKEDSNSEFFLGMPPKKQATKKTEQKKADKIVADKTFGLKNKNKSKSVQKYIQGVTAQVKGNQNKVILF